MHIIIILSPVPVKEVFKGFVDLNPDSGFKVLNANRYITKPSSRQLI